jgi:alanine dehydrogenase
MLVLDAEAVQAALDDEEELIAAMARAMWDLSAGRAWLPERVAAEVPERDGMLLAMPAYLPASTALVAKLVSLFPHNTEVPTHHALIGVFDPDDGHPLAVLDGEVITARRTAACCALATRILAREDASVLAILGTGVQARAHAHSLPYTREFSEVRIAGRTPEHVEALAEELGAVACESYEQALDGADVVCAATHSSEPVVRREWLSPGTHINSVGFTDGREVDGATVAEALLVVESRAAALAPFPSGSSDLLLAIDEGEIDHDHIHAELGELVAGTRPGRESDEQLTLYKSVGVAVQDAAAASMVLRRATA